MIPTIVKTDLVSQQQAKAITPVKPVASVALVNGVANPGNTQHEFVLGEKYQALVDKRLPNGNFNVLISNKPVQMQLPEHVKPGDKLALIFLSHTPRLKFALQTESQVNLKGNASISPAGRLIDILIHDTGKLTARSPATTPLIATPIVAGLLMNKQDFPVLLQQAIYQSGLFYESHLSKWINGKNSLEKLQLEPQNKLITSTEPQPAPSSTSAALSVGAQNLSLIQQQLMTLETGRIIWHGEIWDGQHMKWTICEDAHQNDADTSDPATRWKTTLTLTLPELGKITATMTLNAQDIQIKLSADNPETRQLLADSQTALKTNLQTAGLPVTSFALQQNE